MHSNQLITFVSFLLGLLSYTGSKTHLEVQLLLFLPPALPFLSLPSWCEWVRKHGSARPWSNEPNTLKVAWITQLILQFPFTGHSKGGLSISKNYTYHGSIHFIPVTMDGSSLNCPKQPLVCPKWKPCSGDSSSGVVSRWRSRSTRLWFDVRDLENELATGVLCPVAHIVQSIHSGIEDKRDSPHVASSSGIHRSAWRMELPGLGVHRQAF